NSEWHVQDLRVQPWFGWLLGGFATDAWQKKLWSAAVTAIALAVAWAGLRWAERSSTGAQQAVAVAVAVSAPALAVPRPGLPARAQALTAPAALARWWPLGLPALASLFGLIVLRGETKPAAN